MGIISEKPDAYGPFWIATSLIFIVAVSSHISSFLSAWMLDKKWAYDFQSFLTLASMVYSFLAGVPLVLWFGIRQFNSKFKLITALCLYGYSFIPFIPAAALSIFPSQIFPFPYACYKLFLRQVMSRFLAFFPDLLLSGLLPLVPTFPRSFKIF